MSIIYGAVRDNYHSEAAAAALSGSLVVLSASLLVFILQENNSF